MKDALLRKYLETKLEIRGALEAHPRIHQVLVRTGRLLRGDLGPALEREEGQGFVEYLILLAVALMIGAAVFAVGRYIKQKYVDAGNAVQGIQVDSP